MSNHLLRRTALVVALAVLAACGGGGGGGGGSAPPPSPPPPSGGPSLGTLAIDEDTAIVLPRSLTYSELALQLAGSVVDAVIGFSKPDGQAVANCESSGTRTISLVDNDGDLVVSTGDAVAMAYDQCDDGILGARGSGGVAVTITEFDVTTDSASVSGSVTFDPGFTTNEPSTGETRVIDASYSFIFNQAETVSLRVTATGSEQLSLSFLEGVERVSEFDIYREFGPGLITTGGTDPEGLVTVTLDYDSGVLGGTVQCRVDSLGLEPDSLPPLFASARCTGLGGSTVRIPVVDQVELDSEGDGSFELLGQLQWAEVFGGYVSDFARRTLDEFVPGLPSYSLALNAVDIEADPTRNRVLVLTSPDQPTLPNYLVALDPQSRTLSEIAALPEPARFVVVSDDGQYYYVALEAPGAPIYRLDAATGALDAEIDFVTDFAERANVFPVDIDVSPADSRTIAVLLQETQSGQGDVLVIDDTIARPNSLFDLNVDFTRVGLRHVAFTPSASGLYIDTLKFVRLVLDADGAVSAAETEIDSGPFQRLGDALLARGTLLDGETLIQRGQYAADPILRTAVPDLNAFLQIQDDQLVVESLDRFLPLGSFALGTPPLSPPTGIAGVGGHVVVINGQRIYAYELSAQPVQDDGRCETSSVTSQQGADIDRINCIATDIAYDGLRNRLYILLQPREQGVVGNSVAVFDADTLALIDYVPAGDSPRWLALSSDNNSLFVAFDSDNRIAVVGLEALEVVQRLPIPVQSQMGGPAEFMPRRVNRLAASSIVADGIAFSFQLGEFTGFAGFGYFQGGSLGENIVMAGEVPPALNSIGRTLEFEETGGITSVVRTPLNVTVSRLSADDTGVVVTGNDDFPAANEFSFPVSRANGEIIDSEGRVLDTQTGTVTQRFDLLAVGFDPTVDDSIAVLADGASSSAYFLFGDGTTATIARFDLISGDVTGEVSIEAETASSELYPPRIITMGPDRIAVFLSESSGVAVFEAAAFQ